MDVFNFFYKKSVLFAVFQSFFQELSGDEKSPSLGKR